MFVKEPTVLKKIEKLNFSSSDNNAKARHEISSNLLNSNKNVAENIQILFL